MRPTGLLRRLAAILYDALLLLALLMLATVPFIAARRGEMVDPADNTAYQLTLLVIIVAYFVGYWSWRGRTLGMQSWGLQLETPAHGKPSPAQCVLRFVTSIVSWMPAGLGFLWQLWDRDKLAWHDRLSGTQLMHYPKAPK